MKRQLTRVLLMKVGTCRIGRTVCVWGGDARDALNLRSFDKKATNVFLRSPPKLRGHFCSQKRTGYTTREQIRSFFSNTEYICKMFYSQVLSVWSLSATFTTCKPYCGGNFHVIMQYKHMKSRRISSASMTLTATVHTNLKCIFVGGQGRTYVSRWDKVLQDYSALRARLFNSLDLLEGTNLLLYAINKTTLVSGSLNMADFYHSINSKNGTRRKREGRRRWLEHKDWSYQPHHCVHRKISL